MAKKLAKAQMGKIVKAVAKPVLNASKPIFKKGAGAVAAGAGALVGAAGYITHKPEKKPVAAPKKKMGGSKSLTKAQDGLMVAEGRSSADDFEKSKVTKEYIKEKAKEGISSAKEIAGNVKSKVKAKINSIIKRPKKKSSYESYQNARFLD